MSSRFCVVIFPGSGLGRPSSTIRSFGSRTPNRCGSCAGILARLESLAPRRKRMSVMRKGGRLHEPNHRTGRPADAEPGELQQLVAAPGSRCAAGCVCRVLTGAISRATIGPNASCRLMSPTIITPSKADPRSLAPRCGAKATRRLSQAPFRTAAPARLAGGALAERRLVARHAGTPQSGVGDGAGLPVPRVVAAGEFLGPWGKLQSFLAIEELTDMLPLHEAIPLAARQLEPATFHAWKAGLTRELARLARILARSQSFPQRFISVPFFHPPCRYYFVCQPGPTAFS